MKNLVCHSSAILVGDVSYFSAQAGKISIENYVAGPNSFRRFQNKNNRRRLTTISFFFFSSHTDNGVERVQELTRFLQPDDLLSGKYDYTRPTDYQCARNCDLYPESRLCYYKFVLEQYHVMGP